MRTKNGAMYETTGSIRMDSSIIDGISFKQTNFLHELQLTNSSLTGCNFHGCRFYPSVHYSFDGSDIEGCDFRDCRGVSERGYRTEAAFIEMIDSGRITFNNCKRIYMAKFSNKTIKEILLRKYARSSLSSSKITETKS